jgi:hypothetical protein
MVLEKEKEWGENGNRTPFRVCRQSMTSQTQCFKMERALEGSLVFVDGEGDSVPEAATAETAPAELSRGRGWILCQSHWHKIQPLSRRRRFSVACDRSMARFMFCSLFFSRVCLSSGLESVSVIFSCFQIGGGNSSFPPHCGNRFQIPGIFIGLLVATVRFHFHFRKNLRTLNEPLISHVSNS